MRVHEALRWLRAVDDDFDTGDVTEPSDVELPEDELPDEDNPFDVDDDIPDDINDIPNDVDHGLEAPVTLLSRRISVTWTKSYEDPDQPEGDLDPSTWGGRSDSYGYCPLCGDEHENPDGDQCPPEYARAERNEFEFRPYSTNGLEYR